MPFKNIPFLLRVEEYKLECLSLAVSKLVYQFYHITMLHAIHCPANIRQTLKNLSGGNTLAYYVPVSATNKFMRLMFLLERWCQC